MTAHTHRNGLRGQAFRRITREPEHRQHNMRRTRRLLRAGQLGQPCIERISRPFQCVVVDAHQQPWRVGGPQREPRRDGARKHHEDNGGQPSLDARPRSDCLSTRHAVATTVRR